jgi:hypothetical protein
LCQIALGPASLRRAELAVELAFLSAGDDQPFAPAGTAQAVRDGIRPYVSELMDQWGTGDAGLDMALVAVSVAFPVEAAGIVGPLRDWFGRTEPSLRTALGLALAFHSSTDDAARRIVEDEIRKSIRWIHRRRDGGIGYGPSRPGPPPEHEEPYIDSPIIEAIRLARLLQRGEEEQAVDFTLVYRLLMTMMASDAGRLIHDSA